MLFSSPSEYALRAALYLARQPEGCLCSAADIAGAEEIPRPFLSKILVALVRANLVRSVKGPGGGYCLARAAARTRVLDVVRAVEDVSNPVRQCVLGFKRCSDERPCPLHPKWKQVREQFMEQIGRASLAQFASAAVSLPTLPSLVDGPVPERKEPVC